MRQISDKNFISKKTFMERSSLKVKKLHRNLKFFVSLKFSMFEGYYVKRVLDLLQWWPIYNKTIWIYKTEKYITVEIVYLDIVYLDIVYLDKSDISTYFYRSGQISYLSRVFKIV